MASKNDTRGKIKYASAIQATCFEPYYSAFDDLIG